MIAISKFYLVIFAFSFCLGGGPSTATANSPQNHILGQIPIQNGGRVKPLDSFARESLQLLYGKSDFLGRGAVESVFSMLLIPEEWAGKELIQIGRKDIKDILKLEAQRSRFTPTEIMEKMDRLALLFQELGELVKNKEKLNPYYQAAQRLESQLGLYQSILSGQAFAFFPPAQGDKWTAIHQLDDNARVKFEAVAKGFASTIRTEDVQPLQTAVNEMKVYAKSLRPELYPEDVTINLEQHYNHFHPFRWSWISYLLALLGFVFAWGMGGSSPASKRLLTVSWSFVFIGLLLHTYGFGLRVYLSGRPPVSNMYESVIWVGWGAIVFSWIFARVQKFAMIMVAGTLAAVVCMIVADAAPVILDASLQPLTAVLRSNLWLTIHVLTISISYAAFFVAFFLGDIALAFYIKGEQMMKEQIDQLLQGIYLSTQVGVVLLAVGTILGGVWADYSWGRFWGWDPKETWALIALLGYIAVLHGRLSGWLRGFGFAVGSVVSFSLVIMAWYGVNFVLGAGLHSYGFGGGGIEYVATFVGLHFVYVLVAVTIRQSRITAAAKN